MQAKYSLIVTQEVQEMEIIDIEHKGIGKATVTETLQFGDRKPREVTRSFDTIGEAFLFAHDLLDLTLVETDSVNTGLRAMGVDV